jgi:hypothetical protein
LSGLNDSAYLQISQHISVSLGAMQSLSEYDEICDGCGLTAFTHPAHLQTFENTFVLSSAPNSVSLYDEICGTCRALFDKHAPWALGGSMDLNDNDNLERSAAVGCRLCALFLREVQGAYPKTAYRVHTPPGNHRNVIRIEPMKAKEGQPNGYRVGVLLKDNGEYLDWDTCVEAEPGILDMNNRICIQEIQGTPI